MTPGILALVLCAAVFHAVWNILAKSAEGYGRVFVWSYGLVEAIELAPIALWIIARDPSTVSWTLAAAGIVTGLLHIGYGLSLQAGYAKADLSIVYPLARGSGPLITMVCAIALLGRGPPPSRWAGLSQWSRALRSSRLASLVAARRSATGCSGGC